MLDAPDIPADLLHRNLYELDVINQWLGGHKATLNGLEMLWPDKNKPCRILDFGCGGGDSLRAIRTWANKQGRQVTLTGFDLLPEAISYAETHTNMADNISYFCADFNDINPREHKADIVICSLFCHHLYGQELESLLKKMTYCAKFGVVINDLHRHPLAYHSIKWLTRFFSKSPLVKNDAALSVAKGFSRTDWQQILQSANIKKYYIEWTWAFRWLTIIHA